MTYDLLIYTDGGCRPNPGGPGGIGVVMLDPNGKVVREISEGFPASADVTNNRMEITAVNRALQTVRDEFPDAKKLLFRCDSTYVVGIASGAKSYSANADLWDVFQSLVRDFSELSFEHVPAHSGVEHNERCDELATQAQKAASGEAPEKPNAMNTVIEVPELFRTKFTEFDPDEFAEIRGIHPECARMILSLLDVPKPSFKAFYSLRSCGKDSVSSMCREDMMNEIGTMGEEMVGILDGFFPDPANVDNCLRWYLRGLPLDYSIRHELVCIEAASLRKRP